MSILQMRPARSSSQRPPGCPPGARCGESRQAHQPHRRKASWCADAYGIRFRRKAWPIRAEAAKSQQAWVSRW